MNESEARELALRIERFWHARGYPRVMAVPLSHEGSWCQASICIA